jgi:hypothetical protein
VTCVEVLKEEIVVLLIGILVCGDKMLFVKAVMLGTIVYSSFRVSIGASRACVHILR